MNTLPAPGNQESSSPGTLYIMGDSIVVGQFCPPHMTWATLVSRYLATVSPQILTQVTGVNGETTRMALDRLYYSVNSHKPSVVFFQYGINDANFWESDQGVPRVPPKSFESNLHELAQRTIAAGAKAVLFGTNHPVFPLKPLPNLRNLQEAVADYNTIIRKVVDSLVQKQMPVHLIDFATEITGSKTTGGLLLDDGIHLNENGHEAYFDIATTHLSRVLT